MKNESEEVESSTKVLLMFPIHRIYSSLSAGPAILSERLYSYCAQIAELEEDNSIYPKKAIAIEEVENAFNRLT